MSKNYLNVLIAVKKESCRKYILGIFPCYEPNKSQLKDAILKLIDLKYDNTKELRQCIDNVSNFEYAEIAGFEIRFEPVRTYVIT